MKNQVLAVSYIVVAGLMQVNALKCWVSSYDGHELTLENNASWRYCMYAEAMPSIKAQPNAHVRHTRPAYFGVDEQNESMSQYDSMFASNDDYYAVISNCVFEKFSDPNMKSDISEFMFRCVCKTDGCNHGSNFRRYLHHNLETNM